MKLSDLRTGPANVEDEVTRRRRPRYEGGGIELLAELERELPQYAYKHLHDGLFSGEEKPALSLVVAAPNRYRGMVALAAYYLGTPNPGYRQIVQSVWEHDCGWLHDETLDDLALLRRMLRAGRFHIPLSGVQTIYRGVAGIDAKRASDGLSWTTSRDTACWFAARAAIHCEPLVITAEVDASSIAFYSDARSEREVIPRRRVRGAVDPEPSTWGAAAIRWEKFLHELRRRS